MFPVAASYSTILLQNKSRQERLTYTPPEARRTRQHGRAQVEHLPALTWLNVATHAHRGEPTACARRRVIPESRASCCRPSQHVVCLHLPSSIKGLQHTTAPRPQGPLPGTLPAVPGDSVSAFKDAPWALKSGRDLGTGRPAWPQAPGLFHGLCSLARCPKSLDSPLLSPSTRRGQNLLED